MYGRSIFRTELGLRMLMDILGEVNASLIGAAESVIQFFGTPRDF